MAGESDAPPPDTPLTKNEVLAEWNVPATAKKPSNLFQETSDSNQFYHTLIPALARPTRARRIAQLEDALQYVAANEQDYHLLFERYVTAVDGEGAERATHRSSSQQSQERAVLYTFEIKQDHYTIQVDFLANPLSTLLFPLPAGSDARLETTQCLFANDLTMLVVPAFTFPATQLSDVHFGSFEFQYQTLPASRSPGDIFLTLHSTLLAHAVAHVTFAGEPFVLPSKQDETRFFTNLVVLCGRLRVRRLLFALHPCAAKKDTVVAVRLTRRWCWSSTT